LNISYAGKQVFITGARRGIGKAIASSFKENGAEIICPTRDEMDLGDISSVDCYLTGHDFSPSVIILNAAINIKSYVEDILEKDFFYTFQVNLYASIQIIKYFLPRMKKNRDGKIIFISSLYALVSREQRLLYSSSKTAITGLVKTLALELAPHNICINAIAPGFIMTEMTKKNLSNKEIEDIIISIPTGRLQTANEIADLALFLGSDHNKSITGQIITVDGGFLCR
jgi:3-oxoacyl-[acyl-carrier protein] reductase